MVFMDATYKTTKYALHTKSNVGYKVIAEFISQYEDSSSIAEALSVIQSWNPTWKPKYFMTDYCTCEIDAIEARFQSASIHLRLPPSASLATLDKERKEWVKYIGTAGALISLEASG